MNHPPIEPDRQDRLDEILADYTRSLTTTKLKWQQKRYNTGDKEHREAIAEIEKHYVSKEKVRQAIPEEKQFGTGKHSDYGQGYNQAIKDIEGSLGL